MRDEKMKERTPMKKRERNSNEARISSLFLSVCPFHSSLPFDSLTNLPSLLPLSLNLSEG